MSKSRLNALDLDDVIAEGDAPVHVPAPPRSRILEGRPDEDAPGAADEKGRAPIPFPGATGALDARDQPRSGAIGNFSDQLSRIKTLNEELAVFKAQLENGQIFEMIDVALVDPSPFPDRLETTFHLAAFEELKESIRKDGQDQPVLVRPHPQAPGRYQIAYGHRRRRACLELGLAIKAVIRQLDDEEMIAAQRRENQEREQPSYIERVFQIASMHDCGYSQTRIAALVGIDQSLVSRMLQTRLLGLDLVQQIGPCPKSGRRAWETLQELVIENGMREEALETLTEIDIPDGDKRLSELVRRLKNARDVPERGRDIVTHRGVMLGRGALKPRSAALHFKGTAAREFCEWLLDQVPELHRRYLGDKG